MTDEEKPENPPTADEEKPDELPSHIKLIKIKGQDESEIFCRIKICVQLSLFMDQYCEQRSVDPKTVVFLLHGKPLKRDQTTEEVGLEDGDEIDAMLHQTGGCTYLNMVIEIRRIVI